MSAPEVVHDAIRPPRIRHGVRSRKSVHPHTNLYWVWQQMRQRCGNSANKDWRHYGARGVRVCPRWQSSFVDFVADVGSRPSARHSLDRIDPTGDYTPDNVRWATPLEQARNKRPRQPAAEVH